MTYKEFIQSKQSLAVPTGFTSSLPLIDALYPFQQTIVQWALRRGRAALFEDCGLGKTLQQLEWARHVSIHSRKPVLILTPLAVGPQSLREADKFGIGPARIVADAFDVRDGINIANYEKLHHFTPDAFGGIVLDESSILKAMTGKTRNQLVEFSKNIPFRLACTATPAPNDHMELGNHAEFLNIMTATEMLSMFFVHDGGDTSKWRLKGHAEDVFWRWVASWAVAIRKPSDIGFSDEGFVLPELRMHQVTVPSRNIATDTLFVTEAKTLDERRAARKDSISDRVKAAAALASGDDPFLVWCDLNDESRSITKAIDGAVEVTGSDPTSVKESRVMAFSRGETRVLVSKPTICGFGMNWQHCSKMAFVGLSDSYEQLYQAIRRCWRFGQTRPVDVYVVTSEAEGAVVRNIERKERRAMEMMDGMVEHMAAAMKENLGAANRERTDYETSHASGDGWDLYMGDCVEVMSGVQSDSVDYSIFSPPFASLYTYSNSDRDMGNCKDYDEFAKHFEFLVGELYRVLKPGRLLSFHCMNLPLTKERDGFIGIRDFRGEMIRIFQSAGFIFHSEVCIWKDPVTAMQRTKAIGLLYKQLRKDSALSRQGIPDYLVTMRKRGLNPDPVTKTHESFPVGLWQEYASPVWMDINPSKTLQRESAREDDDERHICPLQLEVIERAIRLWTNPNDLVLSPFAGIGSEGYVALMEGRRFIGAELKRSYWEQAKRNLEYAEKNGGAQGGLLVGVEASEYL